jgi:2-keto-3-deoxy-L-rhamnonate aldolase RhmA
MGAQGLLIPHAKTAQGVLEDLKKTRYFDGGERGFSNSPRAGGYGKLSMREHTQRADASVTCIFQIEDALAVENIDALAALPEVTGYLIGRADLALSLGVTDIQSPVVVDAVEKVIAACQTHRKPLGIFVTDAAETARWVEKGLSFFVIGSDQAYLSKHAASVVDAFQKMHKHERKKNDTNV